MGAASAPDLLTARRVGGRQLADKRVARGNKRMITIRKERPADIRQVRRLNEAAFGQKSEADIVDRLRHNCPDSLSLVAEERHTIVGHILFSPVTIEGPEPPLTAMGLAPMAVLPRRQRQGIGSALVTHGLDILKERPCPCVVVLGHPDYYPRFGFETASAHGLTCPWEDVPDAAFMANILDQELMKNISGVVRYHESFDADI
jgi:putative acetyltransferase